MKLLKVGSRGIAGVSILVSLIYCIYMSIFLISSRIDVAVASLLLDRCGSQIELECLF